MKNTIYKNHLLYLSLIAVLVWIGGCFTGSVMNYTEWDLQFKVLSIPILLINSYIIYFLILNLFQNNFISFSTALLYLASPSHVDVFVYRIQFQVLLAESCILLFFYFYSFNKWWKALGFLLAAIVLNAKLLFVGVLLMVNKKLSLKQKTFFVAAVMVILIYLSPQFFKQPPFLLLEFKTIPFIFKNLLFPFDFTILNIAAITPALNVLQISMFTLFLFISLLFLKKYQIAKVIVGFLLVSLAGSFIPFKEVGISEEYFYYYLPSFYPLILFSFLLSIAFIMSKLVLKKGINKVLVVCIAIYWVGSTILIQKNFQDIVNEWHYSMTSLSDDYNNEEIIKFKYAEVLISNGLLTSAKVFIDGQKEKFPNERWYEMLAQIAESKGDMVEVDRVYKELRKSKAPIINDMFEK